MIIKNLGGTSGNKCTPCGTWLAHYEKHTKVKPTSCAVPGCDKKDLVGAHVQKDSKSDSGWYIVPLCNSHNQKDNALKISEIKLAPGTQCK